MASKARALVYDSGVSQKVETVQMELVGDDGGAFILLFFLTAVYGLAESKSSRMTTRSSKGYLTPSISW